MKSVNSSAFPSLICLELVETDVMILLLVILSILGDEQESLTCCGSWDHKESDTIERLN